MNRRRFLAAVGGGAAAFAGCAGIPGGSGGATPCSSLDDLQGPRASDDLPGDDSPADGYPPEFDTAPDSCSVDTDSFDTVSMDGQVVPRAPVQAAYYWYARGEARFADARGVGQYEASHVYGAVSSPAGNDMAEDPVESWPEDERIVCYCGCPHHLSSIRAADLMSRGYTEVYVIEEGFWETERYGEGWVPRNYPVAGSNVQFSRAGTIEGRAPERFAGETAWARHPATDQVEATEISADGGFALHLYFSGVGDDDEITVETPAYRVTAPLGELTDGVVAG